MFGSAKTNIGNDLCTNMFVQLFHKIHAAHAQVGTQCWHADADKECLVGEGDCCGIARNSLTGNDGPRVNQTLLQQWSLKSLYAEVAHHEVFYGLYFAPEHILKV